MSTNLLDSSSETKGKLVDRGDPQNAVTEWDFQEALVSIGTMADEVDRIVSTNGGALARMSAQGDRIDRVQADNRVAINALLNDFRQ